MLIDNIEVESVGSCALCGSQACGRVVPIGEWKICFCADCDLGRTDPRVTREGLARLYDQPYFAEHGWQEAPAGADLERQVVGAAKPLRQLRLLKQNGRLLEIGCGFGFFLEAARRSGFEVEGLEISDWAARQARESLGLNVQIGAIDDFDARGRCYDAIVLFHVLEHLPEPLTTLTRLRELLNPGGVIMVEVPNCASDDAKGFGAAWKGWQPKYHLWHFTPATLSKMLAKSGFAEPNLKFGRSAYVRQRLKKVPVAGFFRCCVDRFYRGDWMRALAAAREA